LNEAYATFLACLFCSSSSAVQMLSSSCEHLSFVVGGLMQHMFSSYANSSS
jgi:hypothetical protein